MSPWIFIALAGAALYTVVNFIDKYNLSIHIKDYRGMAIFSSIVAFVVGTVIWLALGMPSMAVKDALLVMLTGVLSIVASAIYFEVIQNEEATKVILLFNLIPVIVLILSSIFLGERISLLQIVGFVLILGSSLFVAAEGNFKDLLKIDKTLVSMFWVDVLWAVGEIIFKFVVDSGEFGKVVAYESWGWAVGGVLLICLPKVRNSFIKTAKSLKIVALGMVFGNEVIYLMSKFLTFWAHAQLFGLHDKITKRFFRLIFMVKS